MPACTYSPLAFYFWMCTFVRHAGSDYTHYTHFSSFLCLCLKTFSSNQLSRGIPFESHQTSFSCWRNAMTKMFSSSCSVLKIAAKSCSAPRKINSSTSNIFLSESFPLRLKMLHKYICGNFLTSVQMHGYLLCLISHVLCPTFWNQMLSSEPDPFLSLYVHEYTAPEIFSMTALRIFQCREKIEAWY